jgi:hypothetical protein
MVRAILNRMASIYLYDDGREIDVPCRYVEPVVPNKFDKVHTPIINAYLFAVSVYCNVVLKSDLG